MVTMAHPPKHICFFQSIHRVSYRITVFIMSDLPTPKDCSELRALMNSALVEEILHTNNPPEKINNTILTTALAKHRAHLSSLKDTIEATKTRLAALTADSALFSSGVSTLEAILHPIRTLPAELIGRICEHALEDFAIQPFESSQSPIIADSLSMRHPSWTFSHVCRKWKDAIQGHPRCWSHVVLSFDTVRDPGKLALVLADVLYYAGKLEISILIESPKMTIPSDLMSGILPSCRRWRRASLYLTVWDFKALSEMKYCFGALETLYVDIAEPWFAPPEAIDTFAKAPRLSSFAMSKNIYFVFRLPRFQRFIHRGINARLCVTEAREIIFSASSLTSANIVLGRTGNFFRPIPTNPQLNPEHPSLTTLIVSDPSQSFAIHSDLPWFLKCMSCPCLTELQLEMHTLPPLNGSFERGVIGASLRKLVIHLQWMDDSELSILFRCSVSLEHLVLHVQLSFGLEAFVRSTQDALTALPIRTLTFSSDDRVRLFDPDDCSHVVNLCSALWKKDVLKMISIQPVNYVSSRVAAGLRDLEDKGLVVKIKYLN